MSELAENDGALASVQVLDRAELPVDTQQMARFLIGKLLVRELEDGPAGGGVAGGRIVETEAYVIGDPAGHGYRGETPSNRVLFLERGHAHIYLAYGVSFMTNVSSETPGVGAGVLIRAIEPLFGIGLMQQSRGMIPLRDLARGPGRLSAALQVDRRLDGTDLCRKGPLWLGADGALPGEAAAEIGQSTRIGLTKAADRVLRFYVRGSRFVSGPKALSP